MFKIAQLRSSLFNFVPTHKHVRQQRPYLADTIKCQIALEARVDQEDDQLMLKVYDKHETLKAIKQVVMAPDKFSHQHLVQSDSLTWGNRFVLDAKGMIQSSDTGIDSSMMRKLGEDLIHLKNPLNSLSVLEFERTLQLKSRYKNDSQLHAMPDLLYAIPQLSWEGFVALLPDQTIAVSLNLSKHRHLWPAYNYAQSAQSVNVKKSRATFIGQYHFLLSFIGNDTFDIYDERRWLNKGLGVISDEFAQDVMAVIDQDRSPVEYMVKHKPYLTEALLGKFSHCARWSDLEYISRELIFCKATDYHGSVDSQKMYEFIAALPSSAKNPYDFHRMICDYKAIKEKLANVSNDLQSQFFYNQRTNFGTFDTVKMNDRQLEDYIDQLTKFLVYPEFVRLISQHQNSVELSRLCLNNEHQSTYRLKELCKLLIKHLVSTTNAMTLVNLANRWHRNMGTFNSLVPSGKVDCQWHELFKPMKIDHVTFRCITSSMALREEGVRMRHCVGGYAQRCLSGDSHIVSAVSNAGDRSTLQLQLSQMFETRVLRIVQHYGAGNQLATPDIVHCSERMIKVLNSNPAKINPLTGRISAEPNVGEDKLWLHDAYPYDFDNLEIQENIYQAFAKTKTLPRLLSASSYSDALKKSGLANALEQEVSKLLQTLEKMSAQKTWMAEVKIPSMRVNI